MQIHFCLPLPRTPRRFAVFVAGCLALSCAGPALALTFDQALALAEQQSPALQAQQAALASAEATRAAAASLPDPRLSLGVENLPVSGADRFSLTRDFMTMKRIGLMQEVPNRAKREARTQGAQAKAERERAMLAVIRLQLRQTLTRAWLSAAFVTQRLGVLDEMLRENQRLQSTLAPRIAAGTAQATDLLMARQELLALADRRDDLVREQGKARAPLRRLIGAQADETLEGDAPLPAITPEQVHAHLPRHAELSVYTPMAEMARAEVREAEAEARGDWSWEVAYNRRGSQFGDMVSFQISLDLPWQKDRRQQPLIAAKQSEVLRVEAERADQERRHAQEADEQLAELQALDRQQERARTAGLELARQRVDLALSGYESGRGNLGGVLSARRELLDARMRVIDLDAQRADLRARLNNLVLE